MSYLFLIYLKNVEKDIGDGFQIPNALLLNKHWNDALLDFSPTRLKLKANNNGHESFLTDLYNDNETEKYNLKNVEHLELEGYHGKLCKAKFYRRESLLGFKANNETLA